MKKHPLDEAEADLGGLDRHAFRIRRLPGREREREKGEVHIRHGIGGFASSRLGRGRYLVN